MFSKSKMVTTVAAAGAICAVAASGAALAASGPAAPAGPWSAHNPAVPGAYTNTTPALSQIFVRNVFGTFAAWKGRFDNRIHYKYRVGGTWFPTAVIPGADTNTSPAAAFYTDLKGVPSELVVWKQLHGTKIYYAQGIIEGKRISWTRVATLPGGAFSATTASPSVLFPINAVHPRVIIAFRGPLDHVRYIIGTQSGKDGRGFFFGKTPHSHWVPGTSTDPTTTGSAPALTEIRSSAKISTVYVFWKGDKRTAPIDFASTPDNAGTGLEGNQTIPWTLRGSVPATPATLAMTTGAPAVSSKSPVNNGPLLLAYKGPSGFSIRFQTFDGATWSAVGYVNGTNNTTAIGPALINGTLANVSRTTGQIYLHHYIG